MSDRSKAFHSLLGLGSLGLVLLLVVGGVESYRDLDRARQREAQLRRRLDETRERIRALERRIAHLERDPATLERLARDHLGMVRPGEVVILTRPESLAPEPPPARPAASP